MLREQVNNRIETRERTASPSGVDGHLSLSLSRLGPGRVDPQLLCSFPPRVSRESCVENTVYYSLYGTGIFFGDAASVSAALSTLLSVISTRASALHSSQQKTRQPTACTRCYR